MIEIYDVDDSTCLQNLSKQELIGSFKFTLHKVVTGKNQSLTGDLKNPVRDHEG